MLSHGTHVSAQGQLGYTPGSTVFPVYLDLRHLAYNRVAFTKTSKKLLCKLCLSTCQWHVELTTTFGFSAAPLSAAKVIVLYVEMLPLIIRLSTSLWSLIGWSIKALM